MKWVSLAKPGAPSGSLQGGKHSWGVSYSRREPEGPPATLGSREHEAPEGGFIQVLHGRRQFVLLGLRLIP